MSIGTIILIILIIALLGGFSGVGGGPFYGTGYYGGGGLGLVIVILLILLLLGMFLYYFFKGFGWFWAGFGRPIDVLFVGWAKAQPWPPFPDASKMVGALRFAHATFRPASLLRA